MKTLRQNFFVAVVTLLLSVSAYAGQIQCPGVTSGGTTTTDEITTTVILTVVNVIN